MCRAGHCLHLLHIRFREVLRSSVGVSGRRLRAYLHADHAGVRILSQRYRALHEGQRRRFFERVELIRTDNRNIVDTIMASGFL